ncbi:uncharacterized protein F4822DRAFT_430048 [Hypoxylon trugodes]|uniref:uncharacterized protein n=1 Tax=Hypoxylon trugodes TaxID=326681 RepID=UPI00219DD5A4|nr:uncharacterized protein F4822DRAFT_430048 [Hypoxylon trugodes]KAI1387294.1 hypothetical protein F4822DRAFT_430048 [Hypoxylon trugodes]
MPKLHDQLSEFCNISLGQCGMLFLSTPHYRSKSADWGKFWVEIVEITTGVRRAIIHTLQTLNLSVVDVMELWKRMEKKPVVRCLCEAEPVRSSWFRSGTLIVEPSSASFLGYKADKAIGTDHHTICKFKTPFENAYNIVVENFISIRRELLRRKQESRIISDDITRPFGYPPNVPSRTPLPACGRHFYLGYQGLRNPNQLVGQSQAMIKANNILDGLPEQSQGQVRKHVCLTGIGGIGYDGAS